MEKEIKKVEEKTSKKKLIAIIAAAIILVIGIIVLIVCLVNKPKSNEKELKNNLKKLGSQFYTEFYYPAQEKAQKDVKSFVAKFEKTGIKVNLENIAKFSKIDKKLVDGMVNNVTKESCDNKNTYVIIKPKSPYGKNDFTVDVNLSCGSFKKGAKKAEKDDKKDVLKKINVDGTNSVTKKDNTKTTKKTTKK